MIVRRARIDDLSLLVELACLYSATSGDDSDPLRVERAFAPLLIDDTHGVVLVAEDDEGVCAYAALTWGWSLEAGGAEALLDEFYVRDGGKGIGTSLLEAVMATASARGVARVFLETEAHNVQGRRFWMARGFQVEDSVWLQREC